MPALQGLEFSYNASLTNKAIVEVHHPDYLSENELHELYDPDMATSLDSASIEAFVALIQSD